MFPDAANAAGHAVIPMRSVKDLGDGDLHHGAAVIDRLIERMRDEHFRRGGAVGDDDGVPSGVTSLFA